MTKIILIRHGATDWNEAGRLQGQQDIPLNARGIEQAAQLARRLFGIEIEAVYTSDLLRACQTAEAVAAVAGAEPQTDARLREVNLGEWEGRLIEEIEQSDGARFERRFRYPAVTAPPGGEPAAVVQERMLAAVRDIAARHPASNVAVVTHGFAAATLLAHFRRRRLDEVWDMVPENGEICEIDIGVSAG